MESTDACWDEMGCDLYHRVERHLPLNCRRYRGGNGFNATFSEHTAALPNLLKCVQVDSDSVFQIFKGFLESIPARGCTQLGACRDKQGPLLFHPQGQQHNRSIWTQHTHLSDNGVTNTSRAAFRLKRRRVALTDAAKFATGTIPDSGGFCKLGQRFVFWREAPPSAITGGASLCPLRPSTG